MQLQYNANDFKEYSKDNLVKTKIRMYRTLLWFYSDYSLIRRMSEK